MGDRDLLVKVFEYEGTEWKEIEDLKKSLESERPLLRQLKLSLPSTRNPKQRYPIAPQQVIDFFLAENIYLLAKDAKDSSLTKTPRSTDVRSNLRHSLYSAFDVMARSRPDSGVGAPLDDLELMTAIRDAVLTRHDAVLARDKDASENTLQGWFKVLAGKLQNSQENPSNTKEETYLPTAALCWAIAIDAVLLDDALHEWIPKVFAANEVDFPIPEEMHFYVQEEASLKAASAVFQDFVKYRWPVITFAIDPVAEQQNIADSFNLQRDLQLALSYAFATGQINFSQLNTFRRQLQQSSDTIALNRTVTGFIHGNDIFGFRFTPRF